MNQPHTEKSPVNWGRILIRAAAAMFCLLLISVYMMSGLYARYVTRDQGADAARVAAFDVQITGVTDGVDYNVTTLAPGQITIDLDNQSEVAVSYRIRVDAGNPAYQIRATVVDPNGDSNPDDNIVKTTATDVAEQLDFGTVGYMAPGGADQCKLSFTAVDWTHITAGKTGASATIEQDFTVYIDVVQVD